MQAFVGFLLVFDSIIDMSRSGVYSTSHGCARETRPEVKKKKKIVARDRARNRKNTGDVTVHTYDMYGPARGGKGERRKEPKRPKGVTNRQVKDDR